MKELERHRAYRHHQLVREAESEAMRRAMSMAEDGFQGRELRARLFAGLSPPTPDNDQDRQRLAKALQQLVDHLQRQDASGE